VHGEREKPKEKDRRGESPWKPISYQSIADHDRCDAIGRSVQAGRGN
jgi:hypothetical protein